MRIQHNSTPVLILNCKLGALGIMRSLGVEGVSLYGVDEDRHSAGFLSRYCRGKFLMGFDEQREQEYLDDVIRLGQKLGERTILIPTSDELSLFVAKYSDQLCKYFLFPRNEHTLVSELISKEGMYYLARKHAVPTPYTVFPKKLDEVMAYAEDAKFPVMLKGIHGNRLQTRTGMKMVIVHSKKDLVENYQLLEDPELPNLMLQEYIPGGDDQIYIFNGYFNEKSETPYCSYKYFDKYLKNKFNNGEYNIVKITSPTGDLIWERQPEEVTIELGGIKITASKEKLKEYAEKINKEYN